MMTDTFFGGNLWSPVNQKQEIGTTRNTILVFINILT